MKKNKYFFIENDLTYNYSNEDNNQTYENEINNFNKINDFSENNIIIDDEENNIWYENFPSLNEEDINFFKEKNVKIVDLINYFNLGYDLNKIKEWLNVVDNLYKVEEWINNGLTPEIYKKWTKLNVYDTEIIVNFIDLYNIDDKDFEKYLYPLIKNNKINNIKDIFLWLKYDIKINEIYEWINNDFIDLNEVLKWKKINFTPEKAKCWKSVISFDDAIKWINYGVKNLEEIKNYKNMGIYTPEELEFYIENNLIINEK